MTDPHLARLPYGRSMRSVPLYLEASGATKAWRTDAHSRSLRRVERPSGDDREQAPLVRDSF
jgi:hypothetical protein